MYFIITLKQIKYYQPFTIFWVLKSQEEWVKINSEGSLNTEMYPFGGKVEILEEKMN